MPAASKPDKSKTARPVVSQPLAALLQSTATISRPELAAALGCTIAHTYNLQETERSFPQPVYLTRKNPRFLIREVNAWIEAQAAKRPSARRAAAKAPQEVAA